MSRGVTGGQAGDTCTAQRPDGAFCDDQSISDAPFPICVRHAADLYRFLHQRVASAEVGTFDHVLDGMDVERRQSGRYQDTAPGPSEIVYYVQVGPHIKIGRTVDLRRRLRAYPLDRRLLATERGGQGLETRRLREFDEYLALGKEWFRPGPDLLAHIDRIRRDHGAPPLKVAGHAVPMAP